VSHGTEVFYPVVDFDPRALILQALVLPIDGWPVDRDRKSYVSAISRDGKTAMSGLGALDCEKVLSIAEQRDLLRLAISAYRRMHAISLDDDGVSARQIARLSNYTALGYRIAVLEHLLAGLGGAPSPTPASETEREL